MDYLSWDLAILSRAVAYNNLSAASSHVGLSQPQLSRIVAKLEESLSVTLLDRETKRKSSWTPAAFKLADIYSNTFHNFQSEVNKLVEGLEPVSLRIGALEGLVEIGMEFADKLLSETNIQVVELHVFDTNDLEEKFFKNDVDLIFSAKEPGRKKFRYRKVLGYQSIDIIGKGDLKVYSQAEYLSRVHKGLPKEKAFVSNSLQVRSRWMEHYSGKGTMPSAVRKRKSTSKEEETVLAIAHDHFPQNFWQTIEVFLK